jgi:hypothetical protein
MNVKYFFNNLFFKKEPEQIVFPKSWEDSYNEWGSKVDEPWIHCNKYNVINKFKELKKKYYHYPYLRTEGCRSYKPSWSMVLGEILYAFKLKLTGELTLS